MKLQPDSPNVDFDSQTLYGLRLNSADIRYMCLILAKFVRSSWMEAGQYIYIFLTFVIVKVHENGPEKERG